MTLSEIIYSLLILLWVYWTYRTFNWIIKDNRIENDTEMPLYVGSFIVLFIIFPLLFGMFLALSNLIEFIINNWNTKII